MRTLGEGEVALRLQRSADRRVERQDDLKVRRLARAKPNRLNAATRRRFTAAALMADLLGAATAAATCLMFVGDVQSPVSVSLAILGWVAIAGMLGLYAWRPTPGLIEAEKVVATVSLGTIMVVLATGASGPAMAAAWAVALAWSGTLRGMRRAALERVRARGDLWLRTLVVTTDGAPERLIYSLREMDPVTEPDGSDDALAVVGPVDDLPRLIVRLGVQRVVVPAGALRADLLASVLDIARRCGAEASIPTFVPTMRPSRLTLGPDGDGMSLTVHPATLSRWQAILKRALDLTIAVPALVITLPLWALIVLLVRVDSPGRALFIQERATKGGQPFRMMKFRTMVSDAEAKGGPDLNKPFFKIYRDERVTRVGKVLRRLSLDELPQLWNVIKGEMSLVGPRPLPIGQVRTNWSMLGPRHEVRAGITGWWQVNGRDDSDVARSIEQDVYYIRNWSVPMDLYILWRTLGALIDRRGSV